jgi:EAL domain-containing protein (putative c-di-GMP-specific phosphodiesterase class I)
MAGIAEGIETAAQSRRLIEMGYEFGQGYYFSPPLPAREIEGYLVAGVARSKPTPAPAGGRVLAKS